MRKHIYLSIMALIFADMVVTNAHAQDVNMPANPNNSSYPESNDRNSPPNEPDHTFGGDSSVYKLPADKIAQPTVAHKKLHRHAAAIKADGTTPAPAQQ